MEKQGRIFFLKAKQMNKIRQKRVICHLFMIESNLI